MTWSRNRLRPRALLALAAIVLLAQARGHAAEPKASASRAGDPVWVFENVTIVPMDREGVVPGRTVVVRGERIASIEPSGRAKAPA